MNIEEKYTVKYKQNTNKKLNPSLIVSIYQKNLNEEVKIGEYERDHNLFFNTFCPFKQFDKEYALISKFYSKTSIIELPSCKIVAEEPWHINQNSFYPTDFYIPKESKGQFGFVAGCTWGDSESFKIQYLDLSELKNKTFKREEKFGYIELPENINLKNAISTIPYHIDNRSIDIAIQLRYNINTGALITKEALAELLKSNGYIVFEKKRVIKEGY